MTNVFSKLPYLFCIYFLFMDETFTCNSRIDIRFLHRREVKYLLENHGSIWNHFRFLCGKNASRALLVNVCIKCAVSFVWIWLT